MDGDKIWNAGAVQAWAEAAGSQAQHLLGHGHTEIQGLDVGRGQPEHSRGRRRERLAQLILQQDGGAGLPLSLLCQHCRHRWLLGQGQVLGEHTQPCQPQPQNLRETFDSVHLTCSGPGRRLSATKTKVACKEQRVLDVPNTQCLRGRGAGVGQQGRTCRGMGGDLAFPLPPH